MNYSNWTESAPELDMEAVRKVIDLIGDAPLRIQPVSDFLVSEKFPAGLVFNRVLYVRKSVLSNDNIALS